MVNINKNKLHKEWWYIVLTNCGGGYFLRGWERYGRLYSGKGGKRDWLRGWGQKCQCRDQRRQARRSVGSGGDRWVRWQCGVGGGSVVGGSDVSGSIGGDSVGGEGVGSSGGDSGVGCGGGND